MIILSLCLQAVFTNMERVTVAWRIAQFKKKLLW